MLLTSHSLSPLLLLLLSIGGVSRADPQNKIHINGDDDYCLFLPRADHTDIGASETPGGAKSYCTKPRGNQGQLNDFWSHVTLVQAGDEGREYVQLTGCINTQSVAQLNPSDDGGQYDSNGGSDGQGNPSGSQCTGYASYVELVEPAANRACVKCCNDPKDCDLSHDTQGCPTAIPGVYDGCS